MFGATAKAENVRFTGPREGGGCSERDVGNAWAVLGLSLCFCSHCAGKHGPDCFTLPSTEGRFLSSRFAQDLLERILPCTQARARDFTPESCS